MNRKSPLTVEHTLIFSTFGNKWPETTITAITISTAHYTQNCSTEPHSGEQK